MSDYGIPIPIVVAAVTGAVSLVVFALNAVVGGYRDRLSRRREIFSKAYAAIVAYEEFPYVVRRRGSGDPEGERIRISTELRRVQEDLAYYSAWLATESPRVAGSYRALIAKLREVAGAQIGEAWLQPPIGADAEMNIGDLGLGAIEPLKEAYLAEVSAHLALLPRWIQPRRGSSLALM